LEVIVPQPETSESKRRLVKDAAGYVWSTGRRKSAVARVRVRPGTGSIVVNGREFEAYFPSHQWRNDAKAPLRAVEREDAYDVVATIKGGGLTGQAGALSLGIARALRDIDPSFYDTLRKAGLMTRDSRISERKKYGLRGARRAFQFSKR
jgi:small subunit ribosomal protein S9